MKSMRSMRIYTNPNDLHTKAEAYLSYCVNKTRQNIDEGVKMPIVAPSHAGLARYLGIAKSTLHNYCNKPEYSNLKTAIEVFKDGMEDVWVNLGFNGVKMAEFMLKTQFQACYQDKQYIEHATSEMPKVTRQIEEETEELTFDVGEEVEA